MRYVRADDPLGAAFAPIRDLEPAETEITGVLKRVRGRRRTRLRAPRLIVVIAVIGAGTGVAAAAAVDTFSAATGMRVRASDRNARAIGTGDVIALGALNTVSVGIKLTRDIPFAPGYESWRAATIAFQTALGPGSPPAGHAFMTSSALRWQVGESAVCSWLDYYVASRATGDGAGAASAAAQIKAAPRWPAITGLSYPSGLGAVVAAVGARDGKLVRALIDTGRAGNCTVLGPSPRAGAVARARLAAASRLGQKEIDSDPVARRLGIGEQ